MVLCDILCFLLLRVVVSRALTLFFRVGHQWPRRKYVPGGNKPCAHPQPYCWLVFDTYLRLNVAKKLSRAVALSAGEGEEKGMRRAAAAAGLEWDSDVGQR